MVVIDRLLVPTNKYNGSDKMPGSDPAKKKLKGESEWDYLTS